MDQNNNSNNSNDGGEWGEPFRREDYPENFLWYLAVDEIINVTTLQARAASGGEAIPEEEMPVDEEPKIACKKRRRHP